MAWLEARCRSRQAQSTSNAGVPYILTKRNTMGHLHLRSRARVPVYAPFSAWAALSASVIAGLVFAALDVGLGWALRGISPWTSLRMIGAIVLCAVVLSPPDTFYPAVSLGAI